MRTTGPLLAVVLGLLLACKPGPAERRELEPPSDRELRGETRLQGTLLDQQGRPLRLADVESSSPGQPTIAVSVGADGSFAVIGPAHGLAKLRMTGVDHADFQFALLLDGGTHELAVELGTYPRVPSFAGLAGIAHFGDPAARVPIEFTPTEAGKWQARIERDASNANASEVHYQLANATLVGHTINGTHADRWIYDGDGDYWSVIDIDAGPIVIEFDPAQLPPADQSAKLEFAEPESEFARVNQAIFEVGEWRELARAGSNERSMLRAKLRSAAANEPNPAVRRVLQIAWAGTVDVDDASEADRVSARELIAELGPTDPLWSIDPAAVVNLLALVDAPEYRAELLANNPDVELGFALWMQALAVAERTRNAKAAREAIAALGEPRYAEFGGSIFAAMFDPDRPSAPGKPVANFALRSLDGKTEISAESMRGKIYLLEFWATWCVPCVAAMPTLHLAHAALVGQTTPAFEVLSVSFDESPAAVGEFQAEQWPMPWLHTHVPRAEQAKLMQEFGIQGIPMMVLVGADGMILASTPTLEPDNLVELVRASVDVGATATR